MAARCRGVRSPGARGSEDVPALRSLLLGLVLLAALPGHCRADSGKHLAAAAVRLRPDLEQPNRVMG